VIQILYVTGSQQLRSTSATSALPQLSK